MKLIIDNNELEIMAYSDDIANSLYVTLYTTDVSTLVSTIYSADKSVIILVDHDTDEQGEIIEKSTEYDGYTTINKLSTLEADDSVFVEITFTATEESLLAQKDAEIAALKAQLESLS